MSRAYFINGESMIYVKGRSDSQIGTLSQLGLTDASPIEVNLEFRNLEVQVNAVGGQIPNDIQNMLAAATITMNLVHFDRSVLNVCLQESMAGAPAVGQMPHAGQLMGNGQPRFAPGAILGNHYIGLNIASPIGNVPWRFLYSYLYTNPMVYPLGTERSIVRLTWRAIPYLPDPWNNGAGAYGATLFDYVLDT